MPLLATSCAARAALAFLMMTFPASANGTLIIDFEKMVPISDRAGVGFRQQDAKVLAQARGGANGSARSARVILDPSHDSIFLQSKVRRLYLLNRSALYEPGKSNVLSFFLEVPNGSPLVSGDERRSFGVWTYHWRPGDPKVGGPSNRSLATDSMMHGYSNFRLLPGCENRWLKVVLSPSAFQQQRNYFHWYAAQGVTGEYDFFSTLRQLQFKYRGPWEKMVDFRLDEIGFEKHPETARVAPEFAEREVRVGSGDLSIRVVLRNPTAKGRRYRFFISSELGTSREKMYQPMWQHDDLSAARAIQKAVGGDGGLGAAILVDRHGRLVGYEGLPVPARSEWEGALVHHIKSEMLGKWKKPRGLLARRDTLTTSVIFWDPDEPPAGDMMFVRAAPSNADDGRHRPPTGFPEQVRPPEGWRSEDIPMSQVGGYFVSEITLVP